MNVLIADDHALFREGLRHVLTALSDHVTIVEASDFPEAVQRAREHDDLDLILVDMIMPGMESFEGLGALREARPGIPIVVVSGSDNQETVRRAIATGAHGFIPKTLNAKVLLGALNLVMSGGVYLPPTLLGEAGAAPAPETDPRPDGPKLTPRQREVLMSLVQGRSNKEIARELDVAEGTVKLHVAALMRVLDVNNRTRAALKAAELGLVPNRSNAS